MSSNPSGSMPSNLPDDFFDTSKKTKKSREDDLAKELEQFEREMAALEAESQELIKEEFEKLQEDKNIDELDQQLEQWKRVLELEKKAEAIQNKTTSENVKKKMKTSDSLSSKRAINSEHYDDNDVDLDDIEDFEDKLSDWRSKGL